MIYPAYIPSPSQNGFYIGPLFVHAYGLAYVFAVAAAIFVTRWRWRRAGGDPDLCYEAAAWGFPAGLIGGRIYFLITTPSQVPPHWWGPFAIWKGGLGVWGGIAAGVLVGFYVIRRRLTWADSLRFMDALAPGLLAAQAIGRLGNYFNQELFGKPSKLPWALKISPDHRPPHFSQYATFQPTFLYEIIWNLGLAGFLIWLGSHRRIKPPGLFALYVAGYAGFRIFEETIRIDYSNHVLGMRLNFWIATLVCLAGLAWFVWIQRRGKYEPLPLDGPRADARGVRGARTPSHRTPAVPSAYGKKPGSGSRTAPRSGGGSRRR
ncbi:MAG: prolipoprotein diacylglyceryl transferase [Solirubrobacterales bacterium]|nr:prolipoprotein diacylglyceryl transferase [Solirubrobacterales bacterium]MBV9684400.1 prolipoprotein diacylglyceryl transferase [Solirubrobacterales bacterium]